MRVTLLQLTSAVASHITVSIVGCASKSVTKISLLNWVSETFQIHFACQRTHNALSAATIKTVRRSPVSEIASCLRSCKANSISAHQEIAILHYFCCRYLGKFRFLVNFTLHLSRNIKCTTSKAQYMAINDNTTLPNKYAYITVSSLCPTREEVHSRCDRTMNFLKWSDVRYNARTILCNSRCWCWHFLYFRQLNWLMWWSIWWKGWRRNQVEGTASVHMDDILMNEDIKDVMNNVYGVQWRRCKSLENVLKDTKCNKNIWIK